jgi:hypothetical protein
VQVFPFSRMAAAKSLTVNRAGTYSYILRSLRGSSLTSVWAMSVCKLGTNPRRSLRGSEAAIKDIEIRFHSIGADVRGSARGLLVARPRGGSGFAIPHCQETTESGTVHPYHRNYQPTDA